MNVEAAASTGCNGVLGMIPNLKSPQSVDTVGSAQANKQGEFLDFEKSLVGEDLDITELTKLVAEARQLEIKNTR